MHRLLLAVAALAGGGAVALFAVRAHVLPARLDPAALAMVDSALAMLVLHAPALLALAALADRLPRRPLALAAAAFAAGLVLFAGAVLLRAVTGASLGPVAPAGGGLLIGGWLTLLLASLARR